jgi:hypothetical protein
LAIATPLAFALAVPLYGLGMGLPILPVVIRVFPTPVLLTVLTCLGVGWIVEALLPVVVGFAALLTLGLATHALLRAKYRRHEGLLTVAASAFTFTSGAAGCGGGHPVIFDRSPI